MTEFIHGDTSMYGVPVDFTCPTAKRALLLAGASLVIAIVALIRAGRTSITMQQSRARTAQGVIDELSRRLRMTGA